MSRISFGEIFSEESGLLSVEKLEKLLDNLLEEEAKKSSADPDQLIRIVHQGEVIWVTAAQAEEFLNETSSDGEEVALKKNVERALKGNRNILQQELLLLLALATSTLARYRDNNILTREELDRLEPALRRRENEITSTFSQLAQVESKIETYRKQQPVLAEYERCMAELLNAQQVGDMQKAQAIAAKLVQGKRQYVLLSRALQPDVNESYYHRLESQKIKKKILNTQQGMVTGHERALQLEIGDLHNQFKKIKADATAGVSAGTTNIDEARAKLTKTKEEIEGRVKELETVKQESQVIAKQEAETEATIAHIAENVLGDTDLAVDMDKHMQQQAQKKSMTKAPPVGGGVKKPGTGMATSGRRR